MSKPLLSISNLSIKTLSNPKLNLLENISFDMRQEILGIVGASGSGKSLTVRAILQLLPKNLQVSANHLFLNDINLQCKEQIKVVRGKKIGLIVQDPKYSLNPLLTVGYQIQEMFKIHKNYNNKTSKNDSLKLLDQMQINDPVRVFDSYPYELSGGMAQRVMIAIMLATEPTLLIADEATSSLDKKTEYEIINLLKQSINKKKMGLLFISHDIELITRVCHRIIIMNNGKIEEILPIESLWQSRNPYTQKLIRCANLLQDSAQLI